LSITGRTLFSNPFEWIREGVGMTFQTLLDIAQQVEAGKSSEIPLALVWCELVDGTSTVVESFFGPARCYVLLADNERPSHKLSGRRLEILERVLSGQCQKSVAIELGLSAATIAVAARQTLALMGVAATTSRAHPFLMLAAKSAREGDLSRVASHSIVDGSGTKLRCLSIPRPERHLHGQLPSAEFAVMCYLVEGHSHREIAKLRHTSVRTIANQLASIFRRQGVSGRSELIHALFASSLASLHAHHDPPKEKIALIYLHASRGRTLRRAWRHGVPSSDKRIQVRRLSRAKPSFRRVTF
jgi:DNA-binding NarL/FixJ family response regulator